MPPASPTASTSHPACEERITAARIVLEKFGHARDRPGPAGAVRRQHRAICQRPSLGRPPRPQHYFGTRRIDGDMRLNVFHYPIHGWVDSIVLNFLMGRASVIQIDELSRLLLPAVGRRHGFQILPVELRHAELGRDRACASALDAGHDPTDAQASVNYWYARVADTFGRAHFRPFRHLSSLRPAPAPQRRAARPLARQRTGADPGRAQPAAAAARHAHAPAELRRRPMDRRHRPPRVLAHAVTGEPSPRSTAPASTSPPCCPTPAPSAARPCAG